MKRFLCLLMAVAMMLCLVACFNSNNTITTTTAPKVDPNLKGDGAMTWAQYHAAQKNDEVVIEAFVQGKQAWWFDSDNNTGKGTFYLQDGEGGYFVYEMACTEDEYNKLAVGVKVRISGYKTVWSGEEEVIDATFEIIDGDTYIAEPTVVTELLGNNDEIVKYQNMLVRFEGLEFVGNTYKGGTRGNDIYVSVRYNGALYEFCVESYLTGPDSDLYKAVEALNEGDIITVDGFLYWYEGVNTHITGVTVK